MKLKAMTNREWAQKHYPDRVVAYAIGGVEGCPHYKMYNLDNSLCGGTKYGYTKCKNCWDLPAKRNGKYIMRKVK